MQHQSQYPQYSGVATTSSQTRVGQGSTSRVAPSQGGQSVRKSTLVITSNLLKPVSKYEQISTLYHSWSKVCVSCSSTSSRSSSLRKTHGPEKAAAMTKDLMRSWQQKRQMHPELQAPMHSAAASSTAFAQAKSLQIRQFQIPNHNLPNEGAPQPHFRRQEWTSAPAISVDERLAPSQPHQVAPSDNSAPQTSVSQGIVSPQEFPIFDVSEEDTPDHSATTTNFASTFPTAPSSQSHSILLAPEEKSTALYTMRGLAASIKRSLIAERLAASEQPTATSETPAKMRKLSPSDEAVDTARQSSLATAGTHEPAIIATADTVEMVPVLHLDGGETPPSATVPSPFPQVSVSQPETVSSPDEVAIPNSYQEPSHDFVPFSTLAGAVSFDDATGYAPADHPTIPSPVASPLESLTNPQQAPDIVPHDTMDIPLLSFTESSFNSLSFPTRTPTPPLSATITPFRDDDVANGKTQETPPSTTNSPCLDQVEIQPESISPAGKGSPEARVISAGDDQDRICFDVTSLSSELVTHPEAQILNSPKEETRVFVRRTGLLDSSIEEISGEPLESVRTEEYPGDETRKLVRTSEVPSAVHTSTRPTSGRSTSPAATSGSSVFLKPPVKSARKPTFYIDVPPRPEWVRRAKRREAASKGPASEEVGELFTLEPPCSFLIYLGQRSDRGS